MTESYISKNNRWKKLVKGYMDMPFNERMPLVQFLRSAGIRKDIYERLKIDYNLEARAEQLRDIREISERVLGDGGCVEEDKEDEGLDPQEWLERHYLELVKYTFASAKKGNAQSQALFAKLAGKLVEKSEVKIGISADDYFRIREEARQRARGDNGESDGDRSLLAERSLLPEKVWPDKGRKQGDNTV